MEGIMTVYNFDLYTSYQILPIWIIFENSLQGLVHTFRLKNVSILI